MAAVLESESVVGAYVNLEGETYYRIANSHKMPEFFMSLVGASDHWMFISSVGALTAGRKNPDLALFPYAADDQISAARASTGSLSLLRVQTESGSQLWEPFATHASSSDQIVQNLYKSPLGTKLIFEEVNHSLRLTFRYQWVFSKRFGFVRSCWIENFGDQTRSIELLDGLQNLLPAGVDSEFQMRYSNLANAYKKNELISESNIGLFYLSSIPTDRAKPSEGLRATTVWQTGLNPDATLISTDQIAAFRSGNEVSNKDQQRGKKGAYLVSQSFQLGCDQTIDWRIIAELPQDHSAIVELDQWIKTTTDQVSAIEQDVQRSEQALRRIVSSADGFQCGSNPKRVNRHLSNTVFNVMRGGVPMQQYEFPTLDFIQHVAKFNLEASRQNETFLAELPDRIHLSRLRDRVSKQGDPHLNRLAMEYLPLAFSRRHGDPTRPWNRFSIEILSDDGTPNLNYQGNWRDIFQNWEALMLSFPNLSSSMIGRFVNATTADGYNPYRLMKDGFEWEEPSPEDPWANIGYWGDHQIIYLLKLLEWSRRYDSDQMDGLLNSKTFTHANVPYRIKPFAEIKKNASDTIEFDAESSATIQDRVERLGTDGKLVFNQSGKIHYVTLVEKLLTLSLAKLSNFVPDGGIWLNTQRPEWNDANNALVGNGLSMVTTCYLYRWMQFLEEWISGQSADSFNVTRQVASFMDRMHKVLSEHEPVEAGRYDAGTRAKLVERLGVAGSDYRSDLYDNGVRDEDAEISKEALLEFLTITKQRLESTIRYNKRNDGLYHSYNLIAYGDDGVEVEYLDEMLEGQVAVLSSGLLDGSEAVELLDSLRNSKLYRANQNSYLLYPDRRLPGFLKKNQISSDWASSSKLASALIEAGDRSIIARDVRGELHFNGDFRNSADLNAALDKLGEAFHDHVVAERDEIVRQFEDVFGHRKFTGRSGTFFGYEGLGSIYWHMVSKLGLAVSEIYFASVDRGESQEVTEQLRDHLDAIRDGIGAEKQPSQYGAFPSDPYSHTPENAGVKQPGMTGQVKEDVIGRFAELGVSIQDGCLGFRTELFDSSELLDEPAEFVYEDVSGHQQSIQLSENTFAYTICQVPVVYQAADQDRMTIYFSNGETTVVDGRHLDRETSRKLFSRTGEIESLLCCFEWLS